MARRDRNAALAGLAALGALMYARSRKGDESEKKGGEEAKATRPSTTTDQPDLSSLPTTPPMGASSDAGERQASRVSSPARAKPAETAAPAAPAQAESKPASGGARSTGIGGATAAQMRAYYAAPRGGARSTGRGGPSAAEMAAYYSRPAPAPASTGSGNIPVDDRFKAPASTGEESMGEIERNVRNTVNALGPTAALKAAPSIGRGVGAYATAAKEGWKEGRKLREIDQAKKAGAKAMEEAKPILQATPPKASKAARTRKFTEDDMAGIEFGRGGKVKKMASGGMASSSASRRADGIAQRGKTRGKVY